MADSKVTYYEVLSDNWGSADEHHKGDIVSSADLDPSRYDAVWAAKNGVLRELTADEAKAHAPAHPAPEPEPAESEPVPAATTAPTRPAPKG